ncbi:MAG TPA: thiamine diphosphokinase [Ktedonobacteraceae bacterium]|jgi:thiamine pyrophosphokinase
MHSIIFAGGTVRPGKAVTEALETAELIIAADSGASTARQYGYQPALIVGDMDSLQEPLQSFLDEGSRFIGANVEKDETDTELAIQNALEMGASRITLLGALGGERIEHEIANIFLLADFLSVPICIVDGPSRCWLVQGPGRSTIVGQKGDYLSLFPVTTDARGIYTQGLYYPLQGGTLRFGKARGVSNVLTEPQAEISLEQGMLLVVHTAV